MAYRSAVNKHNMYVKTGELDQDQVERAFNAALDQLRKTYPDEPAYSRATVEVNVVCNTHGEKFGIAYARTNEPMVYNIWIGNNPDGSERVELYDDPNWKPAEKKKKAKKVLPPSGDQKPGGLMAKYGMSVSSWADEEDSEDEGEERAPEPAQVYPKLKRKLPPIQTIPAVAYTMEQLQVVTAKLREDMLKPYLDKVGRQIHADPEDPDLDPALRNLLIQIQSMKQAFSDEQDAILSEFALKNVRLSPADRNDEQAVLDSFRQLQADYPDILTPISRFGHIEVSSSFVRLPEEDKDPTTLYSCRVPHWVTEEKIHEYFDHYSSDTTVHEVIIRGERTRVTYPQVVIGEALAKGRKPILDRQNLPMKTVKVIFSPKPDFINDAGFALQMRRQVVLRDGNNTEKVIFDFWRKGEDREPAPSHQDRRPPKPRPTQSTGRGILSRPLQGLPTEKSAAAAAPVNKWALTPGAIPWKR